MKLKELLNIMDPQKQSQAWISFRNSKNEILFKANTSSSFLSVVEDKEVEFLLAEDTNVYTVYLKGADEL